MKLDVDHLRYLIEDAVLSSYNAEDSTGVLLSGGIDSSTVACIAADLPCFTGYYQGEAYDERPWAALVAKDREWHEIEIAPEDFLEHIDDCLRCIRPPFQGPGTFGQYMVAKYVTRYVDTVLSGEGGDELFGGYARLIAVAGGKLPEGYEDYVPPPDYPQTLTEALTWEWEHLPELLAVDEQVTRANGLRAVAPMAEHEPLISYVLHLSPQHRVAKRALKRAMRGTVPTKILNRKDKRGFPVPYVEWAQGPLKEFMLERIGYVPDADKPWDRKWWNDLCESSRVLV